jgi:putative solute:sodium symporter small subunit
MERLTAVQYWRRTLKLTAVLLVLWFVVTFVASYFAHELNRFTFLGFPLGFYMGAQGALLVYLFIVCFYAWAMRKLDQALEQEGYDLAPRQTRGRNS